MPNGWMKEVIKMSWFDLLKKDSVGKLLKGLKKLLKKGYHRRLKLIDAPQGGSNIHLNIKSNVTGNIVVVPASISPKNSGSWLNIQNKYMKKMFMEKFEEDIEPYKDRNWKEEE